jgi:hypothetical protein
MVLVFKKQILNRIGIFHSKQQPIGLTLVPWGQTSEDYFGWQPWLFPECRKYGNCYALSTLYHVNNDCKSWSIFVCVKNFVHFLAHFCVIAKCANVSQLLFSNIALRSEDRYCLLCLERVGLWYLKVMGVCRYKVSISSWSSLWITYVLLVNYMSQVLTVVFKLISSLFWQLLML